MHEMNYDHPVICLGCAHPGKFNSAIKKAIGFDSPVPQELKNIFDRKEKMSILKNNSEDIKNFILKHI